MNRRHLLILALAGCSLPSLAGSGPGALPSEYNVTIDSLQWTLIYSSKTATLNSYGKKGDTAIIPDKVEYNGDTYQVVGIGNSNTVFYSTHDNIKKVQLPNALRIVGDNAFNDCTNLQEINLPESVDSIGRNAFNSCKSLKSISIPSKIKVLGEYSIANCDGLTEINLPEGLTTIMRGGLDGNRNIQQLTLPSTLKHLGSYALASNTTLKFLRMLSPTAPHLDTDAFAYSFNLKIVYVPEGSSSSYHNAEGWKDYIIAPGDHGLTLNINLTTPGNLGDEILKLTENLYDVNALKITGKLNDADIYCIQNQMPNLIEIDLSEVDMKELPEQMFYNRPIIRKVILPSKLESIGNNAFSDCSMLESIHIPNSVTKIGDHAFEYCTSLTEAILPDGLTTLERSCFRNTSLKKITLPKSLTTILYDVFYDCTSLEQVDFNDKLQTIANGSFYHCSSLKKAIFGKSLKSIGGQAFSGCNDLKEVAFSDSIQIIGGEAFSYCRNLEKITIPETVTTMEGNSFYGCDNLMEVTCLAMQPPTCNDYNPFSGGQNIDMVLYVPSIVINNYKQTPGWDDIKDIKPLDYLPNQLLVTKDYTMTLPETMPEGYKPTVSISNWTEDCAGHLTLKGSSTLNANSFSTTYDYYFGWNSYEYEDNTHQGTLINKAKMQADEVSINITVPKDQWQFISLPFDAKVGDLKCLTDETQWVIRRYDSETRAKGELGNTWKNLTADSIMHANVGYILQCANNEYSSSSVTFQFTALDNANKNKIFASADAKVAMNEYPAELSLNRSWNLVGNPYPAFFDIRFLDFKSPITIWRRGTYEAYSPIDDSTILLPSEAFFVQKPAYQDAITFAADGRQHDRVVRTLESSEETNFSRAFDRNNRDVYNLTLNGNNGSDRTRFVINPAAEMSYNAAHDAGKMMSETTPVAQLYTIGNIDGTNYAINERPLSDGIIRIGARFAQAGTYTLALADGKTAILTDKQEGKEVELDANGYTFTAKAGECRDRFVLKVTRGTTGINGISSDTDATTVRIYTVDGKLFKTVGSAQEQLNLPAGTYIVKEGNKTRKIQVNQ